MYSCIYIVIDIYIYINVYIYKCLYIYIYLCMYSCICIVIEIYIYKHRRAEGATCAVVSSRSSSRLGVCMYV
jgi:hypothetical protein